MIKYLLDPDYRLQKDLCGAPQWFRPTRTKAEQFIQRFIQTEMPVDEAPFWDQRTLIKLLNFIALNEDLKDELLQGLNQGESVSIYVYLKMYDALKQIVKLNSEAMPLFKQRDVFDALSVAVLKQLVLRETSIEKSDLDTVLLKTSNEEREVVIRMPPELSHYIESGTFIELFSDPAVKYQLNRLYEDFLQHPEDYVSKGRYMAPINQTFGHEIGSKFSWVMDELEEQPDVCELVEKLMHMHLSWYLTDDRDNMSGMQLSDFLSYLSKHIDSNLFRNNDAAMALFVEVALSDKCHIQITRITYESFMAHLVECMYLNHSEQVLASIPNVLMKYPQILERVNSSLIKGLDELVESGWHPMVHTFEGKNFMDTMLGYLEEKNERWLRDSEKRMLEWIVNVKPIETSPEAKSKHSHSQHYSL